MLINIKLKILSKFKESDFEKTNCFSIDFLNFKAKKTFDYLQKLLLRH